MIPRKIHFVFGLEEGFGGVKFSYIHYLAVASAWEVHQPDEILFHCAHEPSGEWWERARSVLTLNKIDPPRSIFGNPVDHYAHKADVVRMQQLLKSGGIYFDIDVISINKFGDLLDSKAVLGRQTGRGLCNAIMLFQKDSSFLQKWYDSYRKFDSSSWDYHSVILPKKIYEKSNHSINVISTYKLFYPSWEDPKFILFDEKVGLKKSANMIYQLLKGVLKNIAHSKEKLDHHAKSHVPYLNYHFEILKDAYCIHLWQSKWWEDYLKEISPKYVLEKKNNFSKIVRYSLSKDAIVGDLS